VPIGNDSFIFTLENDTNQQLSTASATKTIIAGVQNSLSLTLTGIIASFQINPITANDTAHLIQSSGQAVSIIGAAPQKFTVTALDIDGNTISGAPTFTSGSPKLTLSNVSGTYTAQVTSYGSSAISLTPSSGTTTIAVTTEQELWATNCQDTTTSVYSYALSPTGPQALSQDNISAYIPGSGACAMAVAIDAGGNRWVSDFNTGELWEFAPGTSTPTGGTYKLKLAGTNHRATGLAFDLSGNLYLADSSNSSGTHIRKYSQSSLSGTPNNTVTISSAANLPASPSSQEPTNSLAFDTAGILWITNPYSSTKSAVAYNTTSAAWVPSDTIAAETVDGDNDGQTYQVAFDPTDNGHVWLTESWKGWLERYMPGATSSSQALTNIYAGYSAFGLAIGGDGTIWTAIQDMNNNTTTAIYGYASGSTTSATPVYQILTIPNCNYSLNMLTISP